MKSKFLLFFLLALIGSTASAQFELHLGYSSPQKEFSNTGYAMKGLVAQFGGRISQGEIVHLIANMALGYNAMDAKRFGQDYANAYWRADPAGVSDSIISLKTGTYLYSTFHVGLEIKIPVADMQIPIRGLVGPHMFFPPNKHTIKSYGTDIEGNVGVIESENIADWSYDVMGMSYQIGTGVVLSEHLSLRAEYFKSLGQLGDKDKGTTPWKYNSLFFSVGVIF